MRLIDADAIVFTHAIARSLDDGHNWNELCVTKDEIDDMPTAEPERTAKAKVNFRDENYYFGWCECGQYQNSQYPYCPNCGAKLDWSGNDEKA